MSQMHNLSVPNSFFGLWLLIYHRNLKKIRGLFSHPMPLVLNSQIILSLFDRHLILLPTMYYLLLIIIALMETKINWKSEIVILLYFPFFKLFNFYKKIWVQNINKYVFNINIYMCICIFKLDAYVYIHISTPMLFIANV